MRVRDLEIPGARVVELHTHGDDRGAFAEVYRHEWLPDTPAMVQANHAQRRAGTVVGLHYHLHQADYWYVTSGRARAVLHDLRPGPNDGRTVTLELGDGRDGAERLGLYIPPGVAHGFAALADLSLVYLVDHTYDPADELGLAWNDPAVAADWGIARPILSPRDKANPSRQDLDADQLPGGGPGARR